ncbi:MAG TPA: 4Fe-4S dicluster domain-containing protein, partial [Chitinispirillaceae bacterium]|nr:4Fe-4S dicluster domain-containing protein [Chitinispirillaceae bacterium]
LEAFNTFIGSLRSNISTLQRGTPVKEIERYHSPLAEKLMPTLPRIMSRMQMSGKTVDRALCTKCKKCISLCPYGAVQFTEWPEFEIDKCQSCWRCYNLCPSKAIYTKKYRGVGHYPGPIDTLIEKLTVS